MNASEDRLRVVAVPDREQPVFFLDLGDPWSYLAAEQVMGALPVPAEWEPVLASDLGPASTAAVPDRAEIERRAAARGLQPLRWPPRWPAEGRLAALAACYAKGGGRTVAFALALMRQQFAAGRDIDEQATVLIAAAASEMHPAAVLKGVSLRGTVQRLQRAVSRARDAGVVQLPAVSADGQVFAGPDCVEQAAVHLPAGHR